MTDEVEDEDVEEYEPEALAVGAGMVYIFDSYAFQEATGAIGIQITDECVVYIINQKGELELLPLAGKARPKLNPVK